MPLPAPVAAVAHRATNAAKSAGQSVALYALLGIIGLVGIGFLLAALYIWLAALTDPLIAALIIGGSFLGVSVIWALILVYRGREAKRRRREALASTAMMASSLSFANTGLRLLTGARRSSLLPAAVTLLVAWFVLRPRDEDRD